MRSPITLVLIAGAFALAGSAFAAESTSADVTITQDSQPTVEYKAQLDKCKTAAPTDQAPCRDAVGMRQAQVDHSATATEEIGSLQGRDKCAGLIADDKRACLLNDKGG